VPSSEPSTDATSANRGAVFATTHWSVVRTAARPDTTQAGAALEQLCRTYWYPLYASELLTSPGIKLNPLGGK
jgi:hypothetical protein